MNYCQKIKGFTEIIENSKDINEQLKAKKELLKTCEFIPIDENIKQVMIAGYSSDIDNFIHSNKAVIKDDTIKKLRVSLLAHFSC